MDRAVSTEQMYRQWRDSCRPGQKISICPIHSRRVQSARRRMDLDVGDGGVEELAG